jgi:glucuronoarabinoxylan endo-1,4-beta-xylanase
MGGHPGTGGADPGTGGAASGGVSGTGGVGSGGSGIGTGGKGGSTPATGGNSGTGGNVSGTGGGGVTGTGGTAGTGGAKATGGASGSGGHATGGTGGASGSGTCGGGAAQSSDVTINESSLQQQITGFGVSSAWAGSYANASDPDYLWSTTTGAGLSLLRIRYGDGLAIAQAAAKAGVTVWMTPWGTGTNGSPGGSDTTSQTANGCKSAVPVLTNPQALAASLTSWVQNAKSQGVPLYAVSAENEPDSCGINQTTSYSAAQLATWIDTLGPAMAALGVKVMAPETQNACGFTSYFSAIQNDTAAWNAVGIFASHEYGCGTLPSEPSIAAANKEYWETEVDTGAASGDSPGDGIASALLTVTTMHNDLTKANLNAWHYWWMYCSNNSGCLYDTGTKVWTKRLWAMGNFSRFVRPGWKRVGTSGTAPSGVLVSAYINPANNALSIVAINNNTSSKDVSFYISGAAPCALTPYETSAGKNLGQGSAVSVSQSRVTVTLSAQSVTTLVGAP